MRSTSFVQRSTSMTEGRGRTKRSNSRWSRVPLIIKFVIISGIAGALVNAIATFFGSVMTTLEKRFNINNQKLSYVLMANDVSAILFSPFTTYYMAKSHIPLHLSFVMLLMMLHSVILCLPHLIYGSGEVAHSFTTEFSSGNFSTLLPQNDSSHGLPSNLCNSTSIEPFAGESSGGNFPVLAIFFTGHFINGIATSIFWSLLLTYLDNNVSKAKAPLVHSVSIMIRMSGILLGTFMNNLGLKLYINPFLTPTIQYTDPRWIGAWWFTPAVLGVLFLIPAFFLSRFPEHIDVNDGEQGNVIAIPEDPENPAIGIPLLSLGGSNKDEEKEEEVKEKEKEDMEAEPSTEKASLKDMWISLKRLAHNKLFVYIILGYLARRFGHLPFNTYMVKYMEQLFNVPTADANGFIAKYDLPSTILGVAVSGMMTTKLLPTARQLQGFVIFVATLLALSTTGYILFRCDELIQGDALAITDCQLQCGCEDMKFTPICGDNQVTYNSPCEAGCTFFNEESKNYEKCLCIEGGRDLNGAFIYSNQSYQGGSAREGPCQSDICKYPFYFFLLTHAITNFLGATTWTSCTIILMRAVEPRDKAICLSLFEILGSLFVAIPGPFFLSKFLDAICIRRDVSSDSESHCWIYDRAMFNYVFNGFAATFLFINVFFSGMVWKHLKHIEIFDKKWAKEEKAEKSAEANLSEPPMNN